MLGLGYVFDSVAMSHGYNLKKTALNKDLK